MKSIQSKLSIGLLFSLLGVFIVLFALVSSNLQQLSENYTASRLQHDIETILTAVNFDQKGNLQLKQERINPIYLRPFSGHYYVIEHKKSDLRSRSLWDQSLPLVASNHKDYSQATHIGPKDQPLVIVSRQFSKQGQQFSVHVAEDLSPMITSIQHFEYLFAIIALLALFVLLVIQIFILKLGLKPLHELQQDISLLEKGEIDKITTPSVEELVPLANEINHLLAILKQRLERSRNALSDLSHAIKKPLTVLQQLSPKDLQQSPEKSAQTLDIQVNSIHQLTDNILKRARLSGKTHSGILFDFKDDLNLLIETIQMMYPNKKLEIKTTLAISMDKHFEREDFLELLGNLLDNAFKWANKKITIHVQNAIQKTENWNISIEDDGPGCDDKLISQLAERGKRIDESVQGYGFGLAIARDIVDEYQGIIVLSRSEQLSGFKVQIII